MKKLIALSTLVIAGASFAASTSTTKVDVSKKSFKERLGLWYYGELSKVNIDNDKVESPDAEFLNYLNTSYEINENYKANFTLRMYFTDAEDQQNNNGDRFQELDPRLGIDRNFKNSFVNRLRAVVEVPTSPSSVENDKIARLKLYMYATGKKLDDYNKIGFIANFNKDFYPEANKTVGETSRFYTTQYITYVNSALSETIKPRVDIEMLQRHIPGKADNSIKAGAGSERILVGADMDVLGTALYPYISHDPSKVKASDELGAGLQIFRSF